MNTHSSKSLPPNHWIFAITIGSSGSLWLVMGCYGLLNGLFWVANDYPIRPVVLAETYQLGTYELLFARNRLPDSVEP